VDRLRHFELLRARLVAFDGACERAASREYLFQ
jgi:hypothetical protein